MNFLRSIFFFSGLITLNFARAKNDPVLFTENKGQVCDQHSNARPDVLFGGKSGDLFFHLRSNGISYQLQRAKDWVEDDLFKLLSLPDDGKKKMRPTKIETYRIDLNWVGLNQNFTLEKKEKTEGLSNYYLPACKDGATEVGSYGMVTYKNIYEGIDLCYYSKNDKLESDYLIAANADPSQLKIKISGAEKISVNKDGELIIQTSFGNISENAPVAYQSGKKINCKWKIEKNIISFDLSNYDRTLPLLIDPGVRLWGTYYGGSNTDQGWATSVDASGNVYNAGYTSSQGGTLIATVGSHQSVHGGGLENAYLAKFTSAGVRIWATYYGGSARDIGVYCSIDPNANVFLCGHTLSSNAIASAGAHQTIQGGSWDGFLAKFNSAGVRQWGTYYGGSGTEFGVSCAAATDGSGDVYLAGKTDSPSGANVIETPGSHQSVFGGSEDAYLAKFNSAGVRQWATYYGDACTDQGNNVATDPLGNVYLLGCTCSSAGIATPGAYQTNYVFSFDAFAVKFNNSGIRQWGTYYGGNGDDRFHGFARDNYTGDLYMGGRTASTNSIATDGSYQTTFAGGNWDGFLVKLNSNATMRDWGTYYGGTDEDLMFGVSINPSGHVYIGGYAGTNSTGLGSVGSLQPVHGGGAYDGIMAQFDANGNRLWATYYGGSGGDAGQGIACDNNYNVYFTGFADAASPGVISTAGAHQLNYMGGGLDGFLVKFYDCSPPPQPTNISPVSALTICAGNSTTLIAGSYGAVTWFNVPAGGSSVFSGSVFPTGTLSAGTITFYAQANTCTNSVQRTAMTVTVFPAPILNISSSNSVLCNGATAYIAVSGGATYTWSTGSNSNSIAVSPSTTTTYTLNSTSSFGCLSSGIFTQTVVICTGLDQISSNGSGLAVYPNPVKDKLEIEGFEPGSEVLLYNITGQLILQKILPETRAELDLSALPPSVYVLTVRSQKSRLNCKVVKD